MDINSQLKLFAEVSLNDRNKSGNILLKIFQKILNEPKNRKYRDINLYKITNKFKKCPICIDLLFYVGFEKSDNGQRLILHSDKPLNTLKLLYDRISAIISNNKPSAEVIKILMNDGHSMEDAKKAIKMSHYLHDKDDEKNEILYHQLAHELILNDDNNCIDSRYLLQIKHDEKMRNRKCYLSVNCQHFDRLSIAMSVYQTLIAQNNYNEECKNGICIDDIINDSYNATALLNDFHHLLFVHSDEFENIYRILSSNIAQNHKNTCNVSNCAVIRRNYRDRSQSKHNIYAALQRDEGTVIRRQILDKIHCHFLHAFDVGYKLTASEKEQILHNEVKCDDESIMKDKILMNINRNIINKKKTFENVTELTQRLQSNTKFITEIDEYQMNLPIYDHGIRYLYWKYYKDKTEINDIALNAMLGTQPINKGYVVNDWYIQQKYTDLKDELLNNDISTIRHSQWIWVYKKAMKHLDSEHAKSFLCRCKDRGKTHGILFNAAISVYHLAAMMVYCNYDVLQSKFSETFRRISVNENDYSIKQRHRNYFHLGRLLREFVECFGTKIENIFLDEYGQSLYHGISQPMQFQTIRARMTGPLSSTTNYNVADMFCNNTGIIIDFMLNSAGNWKFGDDKRYFGINMRNAFIDCFWLSDYGNEQERFFIGGFDYIYFNTIIRADCGHNYVAFIDGLRSIAYLSEENWLDWDLERLSKGMYKLSLQMCFRLLLHALYQHYPHNKRYLEFESIPKYIHDLLTNFCNNVDYLWFYRSYFDIYTKTHVKDPDGQCIASGRMYVYNPSTASTSTNAITTASTGTTANIPPQTFFRDRLHKIFQSLFFEDYGWIKLQLITTLFPSLNGIFLDWRCIQDGIPIIQNPRFWQSLLLFIKQRRNLSNIVMHIAPKEKCIDIVTQLLSKYREIAKYNGWYISLQCQESNAPCYLVMLHSSYKKYKHDGKTMTKLV